ncbi:MAG: polyprenyl synthetase family protein [Caldimicrobium sp.]
MNNFEELKNYLKVKREKIEKTLREAFPKEDFYGKRVLDAAFYSLMAGGKRIRPILCLLSYELYQNTSDDILLFACGIECIHTYSLIHDDLPCMDDDDFRRGKPSCHIAFDEATAILAGDGLQALAFEYFTHPHLIKKLDPKLLIKAIHCIAKAAGFTGMVGGQMADLLAQGRKGNLEKLKWIHKHKTAALIRASILSGAILGGAPEVHLKKLARFGENLGLLFQIVDDILDITEDKDTLGKPSKSDLKKQKLTYPSLFGLEKTQELAKKTAEKALIELDFLGNKANLLKQLTLYLLYRDN